MRESEVEGGLKSVASALDLLDCFLQDEELGVSEIARRLGVAKSTAHRLLTTLASRDLVEQNVRTGKYRLGVHLFELGHLALSRIDLRQRSRALLEELREASGWTVHLAIASGPDVLFLERLPTLRGMAVMGEYRRRWPLHVTSSGKAICAYDPIARQARIDAGFPAITRKSISTVEQFERELALVRRKGYAHSSAEIMPDLASVAAPVLDRNGYAAAAISITGTVQEIGQSPDRMARMVMVAAHRFSRDLQRKPTNR